MGAMEIRGNRDVIAPMGRSYKDSNAPLPRQEAVIYRLRRAINCGVPLSWSA
jgi:hypothetical protein